MRVEGSKVTYMQILWRQHRLSTITPPHCSGLNVAHAGGRGSRGQLLWVQLAGDHLSVWSA